MPKPRIIDASFWDDPDVARLSRDERLLLVGIITVCADDHGRLLAHPPYLRKQVFGYDDDVTTEQVRSWRDSIIRCCRNVVLYAVDEQEYIWLRNWQEYQNIRYQVESKLPQPTAENMAAAEFCGNSRESAEESCCVGLGSVELSRVGLGSVETTLPPTSGGDERKPDKPPRQPSPQDQMRAELEQHFADVTQLPPPKRKTAREKATAAELWWQPLRDILDMANWDLPVAKTLVSEAVSRLGTNGMTISTPKSISKTVLAICAEEKRGYNPRASPGVAAGLRVLERLQQQEVKHG